MEQIIIRKKTGSGVLLNNYQTARGITRAEQICEKMGQDIVNISVQSATTIPLDIGDYADFFGRRYKINTPPVVVKANDRLFFYEIRMEGVQYDLIKVQVLDIDDLGASTGSFFSAMGDLKFFAELIIRNANRVYGDWELGDVITDTEHKLIDFTQQTCLQFLQNICIEYECYFVIEITGGKKMLHIKDKGDLLPDIFRYGRGRGLYSLERRVSSSNKTIVTRLFAYGSDRNIPSGYRGGSLRLKMPANEIYSEGQPYIEHTDAISEYGVFESTIILDHIYPTRVGVATPDPSTLFSFFDYGMDFDLNAYLLPGIEPKIHFRTGGLAGYEFSITSYHAPSKRFTINPYNASNGTIFPNQNIGISPGDEYVIIDISMPQSYIDDAEQRLFSEAKQYLEDNSKPFVQWVLQIDKNFIEAKVSYVPELHNYVNYFDLGKRIRVIDEDLGISEDVEISGFKRDILAPYRYEITLSDTAISRAKKMIAQTGKNTSVVVPVTQNPNAAPVTATWGNLFW